MKKKPSIFLKELTKNLVTREYISWLNDYEITRYTEQKYKKHNRVDVERFVQLKKKSKKEFLYGIFLNQKNKKFLHVGNIKLGPINFIHKTACISYLIGRKKYQNYNIGTQAVNEVIKIAKEKFKLKKIIAEVYLDSVSSKKILLKNLFFLEGVIKNFYIFEDKRVDKEIFGKII